MEGERRTATAMLLVRVEDAEVRRHLAARPPLIFISSSSLADRCPVFCICYCIYVLDVNQDEPPIFTLVPSVTRVPEDARNASVLRVAAVDGDRGVDNPIAYRLVKGDRGLFAIDPHSGVVSVVGALDRESAVSEGSEYILEIEAREITSVVVPAPSVTAEVIIEGERSSRLEPMRGDMTERPTVRRFWRPRVRESCAPPISVTKPPVASFFPSCILPRSQRRE